MNSIVRVKLAIILFSLVFVVSCERDGGEQTGDYFVDSWLVKEYSIDDVEFQFTLGKILYPEVDTLIPGAYSGVKIYKINYLTSFSGKEVTASGLICVPTTVGNYPILSFQNGTNTCHSNAPSENPENPLYTLIGLMASHGYIITVPDYIGFGETENILHPYLHETSSNNAIIDLIKASDEFISIKSLNSNFDGNLYLMGYSQGGWATLKALEELDTYNNPDLVPRAAACGAGAYNLMEMGKHILSQNVYNNPFYLPYFIESRRQNDILSEPLSIYFKEPYANQIPSLFDGSKCNSEMNEEFPREMGKLLTMDLIENFEEGASYSELRNELSSNSAVAWNTDISLKFYHSKGDSSVPYFLSEDIYTDFINAGASPNNVLLKLTEDLTVDHNDAIVPWGVDALLWLNSLR